MGDYGHDLAFGTFITPLNARPQDVVALAQTTERAGLDLVTFQDHPSALLDTWTLLTWVATKTERVHLSAQPAVACNPGAGARGGELDLLSGDRFELGVGAGGFWDAIVAMGGEPRTPGQSVDALGEAIDVIRAIWSPGERGGVLIEGEHYRIRGAKRGPEPAHDIQIWPRRPQARMLRLVGTKADGARSAGC